MKKLLCMLLFVMCVVQVYAVESTAEITVKISAFGSPTSPNVIAGQFMAEYIQEESNGEIIVEIYPGATLSAGKQKGSIEQTQIGTIEGVLSDVALFTPWEPKLSVLSLPFLFESHE
ncbi:hypothetical protein GF339_08385, partial [candidate division KSB3 bacterium]|nr:hypothetical protein [candidate division KSB3 bacterium]MBD3324589.1 hypothetical protein [candidate division KSB3 bacterium]